VSGPGGNIVPRLVLEEPPGQEQELRQAHCAEGREPSVTLSTLVLMRCPLRSCALVILWQRSIVTTVCQFWPWGRFAQ